MDESWPNTAFRHNVVGKIYECVTSLSSNPEKSAVDMEAHIFRKARSRDEYIKAVASQLVHIRALSGKPKKSSQGPSHQNLLSQIQASIAVHPSMPQREHVISKLNDEINASALVLKVNAVEAENSIFGKTQSKREYLNMVAGLIIHIRGISCIVGNTPQIKVELNQDVQHQEVEDAITALQNLSLQNILHS